MVHRLTYGQTGRIGVCTLRGTHDRLRCTFYRTVRTWFCWASSRTHSQVHASDVSADQFQTQERQTTESTFTPRSLVVDPFGLSQIPHAAHSPPRRIGHGRRGPDRLLLASKHVRGRGRLYGPFVARQKAAEAVPFVAIRLLLAAPGKKFARATHAWASESS